MVGLLLLEEASTNRRCEHLSGMPFLAHNLGDIHITMVGLLLLEEASTNRGYEHLRNAVFCPLPRGYSHVQW